MTSLIGQHLGNYRVIRLLGAGGSAEVYLGEHIHLKRQAAIKVLRLMLQDEQKADFLIEAQRLVDLSHPSIIQVFDFAIEGDFPYLIMEYAPNGTLRTRHPAGSRLPLETVVSYVKRAAASLQYLHDRKLVHRDVKPENFLIGKNQEILLGDFGIVAIAYGTNILSMQAQAGTPPYMAPEQAEGLARAASDQYSLGIVAYEWLCGTRPFQGSPIALALQHRSMPPPSLSQRNPTISPAVEQVILKALAKEPRERFRTITEFAEALEQASQATQVVPVASPIERDQIFSAPSDSSMAFLVEPAPNEYSSSEGIISLRSTQPLGPLPQHAERAQGHASVESGVVSRPLIVRDTPSAFGNRSSNSSPVTKAVAAPKRKGLPYIMGVVPLIVLVVGIVILGFVRYGLPSQASSSSTIASLLAEDSFQRPDQALWGTASDGLQWVADAKASSSFSIKGLQGQIAGGQGVLDAVIGQPTANVDATISTTVNQFGQDAYGKNIDVGILARWTDANTWYKAFIDGSHLTIMKDVKGNVHTILQANVTTSAGFAQTLRFRVVGTTLSAKVWPSGTPEPNYWMNTVNDSDLSTGQFGIRVYEQPTTVITITHFIAKTANA